ncbi:granzyme A-like [Osmerus eperlanus]|uniref:granzyme A-like n=1 Tax=Osmerus eperlanus TaxID=29151 RepID=UPI002E14E11D
MLHYETVGLGVFSALLCLRFGDCAEVIGGQKVKPHSLPHMALLENSKGTRVCGGTLIHPKWILTAAHCSDIKKVLLGVHDLNEEEKNFRQVQKVTKRVVHPCYDNNSKVNDIMLLKLGRPVKETLFVKLLPLPSPVSDVPAGTSCLVAGWGATKNQGGMSAVLRSVNVTVIDRMECNSPTFYNFKPIITNSMLCAGYVGKDPADSCQGDSGGPLVCGGKFGGVTSFGDKCGIKHKPGVYTFLSEKYLKWIKKIIK